MGPIRRLHSNATGLGVYRDNATPHQSSAGAFRPHVKGFIEAATPNEQRALTRNPVNDRRHFEAPANDVSWRPAHDRRLSTNVETEFLEVSPRTRGQ